MHQYNYFIIIKKRTYSKRNIILFFIIAGVVVILLFAVFRVFTPENVTTSRYETGTSQSDLSASITDSQVLLVTGIVFKDGTVEYGVFDKIPKGNPSVGETSDYTISIIDKNGNTLNSTDIPIYSKIYVNPGSPINLDSDGFMVSIPYPKNAVVFSLNHKGVSISKLNIPTALLDHAVDNIPNSGFTGWRWNVKAYKKSLHNKIKEVDTLVNNGNFTDAIDKLKNEFRVELDKHIKDDYSTQNELDFTKKQIIDLTDEMTLRLQAMKR